MANTEKIVVQVVVKGEKDLKKVGKSADKSTKSFGKMAAGVVAAVAAFKKISEMVGAAIKTFTAFEFQMAKVRAVTGASNSAFKALSDSAQELGRTTFFTAQQVAELQTNFAKLGFTTTEITQAQEATLDLATATGSDLARAAIVAGAAVRGFGLDASETERVVDVMAVAFTSSAMDIEKWQTSMTKVAPIAKASGFSIEDTAAMMSKLTDSGIEASIAGTSLRNILLKMQDPTSDLSKSFGGTIHSLDDLVPAMKKFVSEGGSMADIMEVVDLRQAAAFEQLIASSDATLELRDSLLNANGAAGEMAGIVGDSLEGAFKRFQSALEGLQIVLVDGFIGQGLRKVLEVGANVLNFVAELSEGFDSANDKIATAAGIYKAQSVQIQNMADRYDTLSKMTKRTADEEEELQGILVTLQEEFGRSVVSIDNETDALNLNRDALDQVIARTALLADTEALKLVHQLQEKRKAIKLEQDEKDAIDKLKDSITSSSAAMAENLASEAAAQDQVSLNTIAYDEFGNAIDRTNKNTNTLRESQDESLALGVRINELKEDELLLVEQLTDAGWDEQKIEELLNQTKKKTTKTRKKSTSVIGGENKAKQQSLDIEREMVELLMNKRVTTKEEEARITEYLNKLRQEEIELQLRSLNEFIMDVDLRKKLLLELEALKADTDAVDQKRKDESLKDDIKRAALSGQSAQEAMKSVVRAEIMEAVAGYISSVFKTVPWPLNLVLAAGGAALVGGLVDKQLDKFGSGGMIEEFANGGMVHGKSHAQGGEKFAVGGRVVELEGGEAVINKRSTAMFSSQLSAMNAAGGGVKFADGGLLNQPSFSQQQFNAIGQNQMMGAMGGSSKVVVVEADITDSQNSVSVIQSEATI